VPAGTSSSRAVLAGSAKPPARHPTPGSARAHAHATKPFVRRRVAVRIEAGPGRTNPCIHAVL